MYVVKEGTSKQAWLATVQTCPRCGGQHPKVDFKRVDGQDICGECQKELVETPTAA
jgi:transcription elongation factor Elf1